MTAGSYVLLLFILLTSGAIRVAYSRSRACSKLPDGPLTSQGLAPSRKPMDLTLLVRKVDEPHPYFRRVRVNLKPSLTLTLIKQLTDSLAKQFNVTTIERVVLNDLIMITNDVDLLTLECDDRLEVFYAGSGPPTRAPTLMSTVDGVRSVGLMTVATYDDYLLLFTIRSGIGKQAWLAFNTPSGNTSALLFPSADVKDDAGQPNFYRSDALDNLEQLWPRLKRREALLVVYDEAGSPGLRLIFDIGGDQKSLTRHTWFNRGRLLASWPVTDITSRREFNFFSIDGDTTGYIGLRRFYINYKYGGCENDAGLLVVIDAADFCDYAKSSFTAAPMIAYTNSPTGSWISGIKRGRRMSLFFR